MNKPCITIGYPTGQELAFIVKRDNNKESHDVFATVATASSSIKLQNILDEPVIYKIKTNYPSRLLHHFSVIPSPVGNIAPKSATDLSILLQADANNGFLNNNIAEKTRIQIIACPIPIRMDKDITNVSKGIRSNFIYSKGIWNEIEKTGEFDTTQYELNCKFLEAQGIDKTKVPSIKLDSSLTHIFNAYTIVKNTRTIHSQNIADVDIFNVKHETNDVSGHDQGTTNEQVDKSSGEYDSFLKTDKDTYNFKQREGMTKCLIENRDNKNCTLVENMDVNESKNTVLDEERSRIVRIVIQYPKYAASFAIGFFVLSVMFLAPK